MVNRQSRFSELGFLADEVSCGAFCEAVRCSPFYQSCQALNHLGQTYVNQTTIHPDDRRELYVTLYFQRMLGHYQAVLLMAERGMKHQMEVLLRCILEILFDLKTFVMHDDVFEALIDGNDGLRRQILQRLFEAQQVTHTFTEHEIAELQEIIESQDEIDRDDYKVYMKAELAGLLTEYRTTYALYSDSVNCKLSSLKKDVLYDYNDHQVVEIQMGAKSIDEVANLALTAANYVSEGLESVFKMFNEKHRQTVLNSITNELQQAWQKVIVAVEHR